MTSDPAAMLDEVRQVFERFDANRKLSEANEATTRCELIDEILNALGWGPPDLNVEVDSNTGDWLDYECLRQGEPWLVVEAKRAGKTFALEVGEDHCVRAISTLRNRGGASLRDALKQASGYCNDRAVPFACVTNGYQWVFFRGLSRRDRPWTRERAILFSNPGAVLASFDEFLACLGRQTSGSPELPRLLMYPTPSETPGSTVPMTFIDLARATPDEDTTESIRTGAGLLFGEIHGSDRPEMLRRCYISPGNEGEFRSSIRSLLRDSVDLFQSSDPTYEDDVGEFVDRVSRLEISRGLDHPVIVAGHVGAGKTTFIHRSLDHFRDSSSDRYRTAIYSYVDLEGLAPGGEIDVRREEKRVSKDILERLGTTATTVLRYWMQQQGDVNETELEQADPFSKTALRTLLRDELRQERDIGEDLWEANPEAWSEREYVLLREKKENHAELLFDFIRHLRGRFKRSDGKKYPILLVLDNLDQASPDYQRCIYGLAARLAKTTPAIVVLTLREDTYREGVREDGFLSANPREFVFHVAAPPLDRLVRRRAGFARRLLRDESGIDSDEGALKRMREHDVEVIEVAEFAETALLGENNRGAELVTALAGHNTRDALRLIRSSAVGSTMTQGNPDGSPEYLLECLMAVNSSATIESEAGIRKCLDATPHSPPMHLLRLRILAYLDWARTTDHRHAFLESCESLVAKFGSWGYPVPVVRSEIRVLLADGLITGVVVDGPGWSHYGLPSRISITATGAEHLEVLVNLPAYRAVMACVCRWYDEDLVGEFIARANESGGASGVTFGDLVESTAPELWDAYLQLALNKEDGFLSDIHSFEWVREVRSRSNLFGARTIAEDVTAETIQDGPDVGARIPGQLSWLEDEPVSKKRRALRRIPRDYKWRRTCWIPRILWGLEWAHRNGHGPRTASEIARILVAHADIDVPATNVARAFRDLKGDDRIDGLWDSRGKRYEITDAGSALITSLIADIMREN